VSGLEGIVDGLLRFSSSCSFEALPNDAIQRLYTIAAYDLDGVQYCVLHERWVKAPHLGLKSGSKGKLLEMNIRPTTASFDSCSQAPAATACASVVVALRNGGPICASVVVALRNGGPICASVVVALRNGGPICVSVVVALLNGGPICASVVVTLLNGGPICASVVVALCNGGLIFTP